MIDIESARGYFLASLEYGVNPLVPTERPAVPEPDEDRA